MTTANLIEIFCILDEFCKYFTPELKKHMVDTSGKVGIVGCRDKGSIAGTVILGFAKDRSSVHLVLGQGLLQGCMLTGTDSLQFVQVNQQIVR